MNKRRISRRNCLLAGGAAAASLLARPAAAAEAPQQDAPEQPADTLTVGISTLGFGGHTNAELAEELAAAGLKTIQFFLMQKDSRYWKYNGRSDLAGMTPKRSAAIADTYRKAGHSLHSVGVYTNLIHPDDDEREANLAYFEQMMKIARDMGVDTLITESGHYEPPGAAHRLAYHYHEGVWDRMVAVGKRLADLAEKHQTKVLFEPFFGSFLSSAKRARLFLHDVGSPRIRALLDGANLLEVNDVDTMFDHLKPSIDCLHAKDWKLHTSRGVAAGQGNLDYVQYVRLAARHVPHAPMIMEYVGPKNYKQAHAHLLQAMKKAGIGPR